MHILVKNTVFFFFALLFATAATGQNFESGNTRVALLELYTSEGCSSCPPADRWLSSLKNDSGLWRSFVPVAFHVDYWNYLGWDDRFSQPTASSRQREYRHQGYSQGVYTPGVMLAGEEWRRWRRSKSPATQDSKAGSLALNVENNAFMASFKPVGGQSPRRPRLHIALLGMGLSSEIRAGENRGKKLDHDFVVLAHKIYDAKSTQWRGTLPKVGAQKAVLQKQAAQLAIAAWVSDGSDVRPLQAVGGWLTPLDQIGD